MLEAWAPLQIARLLADRAIPLLPAVLPGRMADQPVMAQRRMRGQRMLALHQLGAAHHLDLFAHQRIDDGVGPVAMTKTNGDVDPLLGEVELPVARDDVDGDIGVRVLERGQPRHQPARPEGRQHADRQRPLAVLGRDQLDRPGLDAVEGIPHQLVVEAPLVGQLDAPALPDEQRHLQVILEAAHQPARRALGDIELLGSARKTVVARHGLESSKRIQGRKEATTH